LDYFTFCRKKKPEASSLFHIKTPEWKKKLCLNKNINRQFLANKALISLLMKGLKNMKNGRD